MIPGGGGIAGHTGARRPDLLRGRPETLPRRKASKLCSKHIVNVEVSPTMPGGSKPALPVTVFTDYI